MPGKKPELHVFPNGLRLIYEPHPSNIAQTHIRAFCHVGSIHEPEHLRGASHFVEHMCFKGSRAFPSWSAVRNPFSESGANFNAVTTKQYTCYIVDCLDSYVKHFLQILGDMMLHSKFDRREYNLELNVVREETKMKQPDSFIEPLAFSGTTYANWIDHDSFHRPGCLPYDDVIKYYHQYYVPQNIVLSVVSSIPFQTIIKSISSTTFVKCTPCAISPILNHNMGSLTPNCESNYMLHSTNSDTTKIEIGVRICDQSNREEVFALTILKHILSGSMSSRLFVELREKRGLTYRSGAYMNLYETTGVFCIYAISESSRLLKNRAKSRTSRSSTKNRTRRISNRGVIPVMFSLLDNLIRNGVTNSEVKRAKQNIKDSLKMDSIAGGDKSEYNGVRVILHNDTDIMPNEDIFDKCYKHITKSDINKIILTYFASRNYYFSVIGGKLPSVREVTRFLLHPTKHK